MLLFLLDTVKMNVPNCNRNSCKCAFSQRIVLRPAVSLLSCGHLLGGVSGLTVMGLSDSVLSCLLFIAGWCYLLDPLCVCVRAHIHSHTHKHTRLGMRCSCSSACVCVAFGGFIICPALLLSSRHAAIRCRRQGEWLCDKTAVAALADLD